MNKIDEIKAYVELCEEEGYKFQHLDNLKYLLQEIDTLKTNVEYWEPMANRLAESVEILQRESRRYAQVGAEAIEERDRLRKSVDERKGSILNRQAILDVLNSFEVVDQSGGEDCYILVENSQVNRSKLNAVGVSSKTIDKYGDHETFCILSLAFGENYADFWASGLTLYGPIDNDLRERVGTGQGTPVDADRLLKALNLAEKQLEYVKEALQERIPGTSDDLAAWLYSTLPFLDEEEPK
ncbi:hypothetical protein ABER23_08580 [Paenibacillus lautus]|uniref:hypothetical protein n=1 Tax=Paenibacillus lautus TaxID=1401 RepID=UPI003D2E3F08